MDELIPLFFELFLKGDPPSTGSNSIGLGWDPRIYIPNKLLRGVVMACLRTAL